MQEAWAVYHKGYGTGRGLRGCPLTRCALSFSPCENVIQSAYLANTGVWKSHGKSMKTACKWHENGMKTAQNKHRSGIFLLKMAGKRHMEGMEAALMAVKCCTGGA